MISRGLFQPWLALILWKYKCTPTNALCNSVVNTRQSAVFLCLWGVWGAVWEELGFISEVNLGATQDKQTPERGTVVRKG